MCNGRIIDSIESLSFILPEIDDSTYLHHCNSQKNDFASWIRDIFHEDYLAEELRSAGSKEETAKLLQKFMKKQSKIEMLRSKEAHNQKNTAQIEDKGKSMQGRSKDDLHPGTAEDLEDLKKVQKIREEYQKEMKQVKQILAGTKDSIQNKNSSINATKKKWEKKLKEKNKSQEEEGRKSKHHSKTRHIQKEKIDIFSRLPEFFREKFSAISERNKNKKTFLLNSFTSRYRDLSASIRELKKTGDDTDTCRSYLHKLKDSIKNYKKDVSENKAIKVLHLVYILEEEIIKCRKVSSILKAFSEKMTELDGKIFEMKKQGYDTTRTDVIFIRLKNKIEIFRETGMESDSIEIMHLIYTLDDSLKSVEKY